MQRKTHWDNIFKTKDYTQVLWHENSPKISLGLIEKYVENKESRIIDVGCGVSFLADKLIKNGYKNITLLDISVTSLDIVKKRLGVNEDIPKYICQDILNFNSLDEFDIWHDRAVFHFLLLKRERIKYFERLKESLKSGTVAIINTFCTGGETQCAGLETMQYDKEK